MCFKLQTTRDLFQYVNREIILCTKLTIIFKKEISVTLLVVSSAENFVLVQFWLSLFSECMILF